MAQCSLASLPSTPSLQCSYTTSNCAQYRRPPVHSIVIEQDIAYRLLDAEVAIDHLMLPSQHVRPSCHEIRMAEVEDADIVRIYFQAASENSPRGGRSFEFTCMVLVPVESSTPMRRPKP